MNLLTIGLGFVLLLTVAALDTPWIRLRGSSAVRVARASVGLGLTFVFAGAVATTAPLALRYVGLGFFASLCERVFGHVLYGGDLVSMASAAVLVVILTYLAIGYRAASKVERLLQPDVSMARPASVDDVDVALLDLDRMLAYTTADPPIIVISRGLYERLDPAELSAVVHHEAAHVNGRHLRDLRAIAGLRKGLRWLPGIELALAAWAHALERAADERAVQVCGSEAVERALWKVADWSPRPAFAARPPTSKRLEALRATDQGSRSSLAMSTLLFGGPAAAGVSAMVAWLAHAHELSTLAGICPI